MQILRAIQVDMASIKAVQADKTSNITSMMTSEGEHSRNEDGGHLAEG
jgi:acyl CoA:acetate/3-ketoacid CoA transferase alpha subunit